MFLRTYHSLMIIHIKEASEKKAKAIERYGNQVVRFVFVVVVYVASIIACLSRVQERQKLPPLIHYYFNLVLQAAASPIPLDQE